MNDPLLFILLHDLRLYGIIKSVSENTAYVCHMHKIQQTAIDYIGKFNIIFPDDQHLIFDHGIKDAVPGSCTHLVTIDFIFDTIQPFLSFYLIILFPKRCNLML